MLGLERTWPANPLSRGYLGYDLDYDRTQDVDQPAGSCFAAMRADFDALGGFDEGFYYWYEDVDLARRLRDRGRIAYVHDATFEHVGGATFAQWDRPEQILSWYHGLFRYFARHRPRREEVAVRALAAVLSVVRGVVNWPRDRERAQACFRVAGIAVRGLR
jgi:N-acetylglucosaminyl-diphospho-decaprenol L-rhamnosyltransferase